MKKIVLAFIAMVLCGTIVKGSMDPLSNFDSYPGVDKSTASAGPIADSDTYPNGCPIGYPLDCKNGTCCPAGAIYHCPQMAPTPCLDPNKLTPEGLKIMWDHCSPLTTCS